MATIFIEREGEKYVAIQSKKIITSGSTQAEAAERAHKLRPHDPVLGERQRTTSRGKPDQWRHMYKGSDS